MTNLSIKDLYTKLKDPKGSESKFLIKFKNDSEEFLVNSEDISIFINVFIETEDGKSIEFHCDDDVTVTQID